MGCDDVKVTTVGPWVDYHHDKDGNSRNILNVRHFPGGGSFPCFPFAVASGLRRPSTVSHQRHSIVPSLSHCGVNEKKEENKRSVPQAMCKWLQVAADVSESMVAARATRAV